MAVDESLMDIELLNETAELGLSDLRELLDVYLDQANEIMEDLRIAIDKNAASDVKTCSHRLAGSSAACGASAVMTTLQKLEKCAREEDLSMAGELYAEAVDQLKLTERFLKDYISDKGGVLQSSFIPPK